MLALLPTGVDRAGERALAEPVVVQTAEAAAVQATSAWLAGLAPTMRRAAVLGVNDPDRARWTYLPGVRRGVALMAQDAASRERALAVVRTGLSAAGWARVQGIFQLEGIMHAGLDAGQRRRSPSWRNPLNYTLAIFGTPQVGGTWGWRIGGHHLSLNVGWAGGQQRVTTVSFGGSPAVVSRGTHAGLAPLADIEQAGGALWRSLSSDQQRLARETMQTPGDVIGRPGVRPWGLRRGALALASTSAEAQAAFRALVNTWTGSLAPGTARSAGAAMLRADPAAVHLAWRGPGTRSSQYFRLQAPGAHLEFWKGGNHIHTVLHLAPASAAR